MGHLQRFEDGLLGEFLERILVREGVFDENGSEVETGVSVAVGRAGHKVQRTLLRGDTEQVLIAEDMRSLADTEKIRRPGAIPAGR